MDKKVKTLLDRGVSDLYKKYTGLYDRYEEEVDLVLGMRYGHHGIQPCHDGCSGVCESSSGSSACGGFMGSIPIEILGTQMYIIYCIMGNRCGCHGS